ncbi:MAG: hypothetical protein SOX77_02145 [Candidatus Borkfalkiaceae bacterium]|nr:hypothetical protein [Christensenellaceae bacterium]
MKNIAKNKNNVKAVKNSVKNIKNVKKSRVFVSCFMVIAVFCAAVFVSCGAQNEYVLTEKTFFLVMTNVQYYPEQYVDKNFEYDCFTYDLTDVNGKTYRLGVRKCSAEWGCKCGKDTIIGFILNYGDDIKVPAPKNQNDNTPDKAWVHLKGQITSAEKTKINVYAADENGEPDKNTVETVYFLNYCVTDSTVITDYSNLNYYVEK